MPRHRRKQSHLDKVLLGLGLIAAAPISQDSHVSYWIPTHTFWGLLWSGVVVTFWGTGAILRSWFTRQSESVSLDALTRIRELYVQEFGSQAPSLDKMVRWSSRNRKIFHAKFEADPITNRTVITASYKLVPVKKEAVRLLKAELLSGTSFEEDQIVKCGGRPAAWYVGDLVGTSEASKRAIMRDLAMNLAEDVRDDTPVFARPLSAEGLHLVQRFRLKPVAGQDGELDRIYWVSGKELRKQVRKLRSSKRRKTSGLL